MLGLDPKVAVHHLAIKLRYRPIKQVQLRFQPELIPQIEVEVIKLIEVGFIGDVKYPTWIENIVPFGYNQIQMVLSNEEMTAFRTPTGIYCYKVMPFGLKNASATYQRAMHKVFDDMLHKYVECYVDDLVLRTNPLKCAFGVTSGKFLGFIVRHRGIKIDDSKIDTIQKMPRPKSLHNLRSLQGQLTYIRRFISNLAGRCQPFQKLMRKGENFVWDAACQNAFDSIKKYLLNPLVLGALVPGKPLILYIAAYERSVDALLAQEEDKEK
ncbi:uncharacterized protein E5676_scaffold29G00120 [Cucumis melo var. makuwa]|uniref:Reverse transcriptase domain-containing protein n=1 Tax=Cucumis melo var. makuwa TaxID=1194695 RepID=A0A5D3BNN9_CUCMM|nr:uncharacterized protein E6C27_scaffold222G00740 [Cucumis melo var. makuwa]TYK01333.1 uncharacterized protein E5676_scaffold29G00120 [Cucumis melo var. makuwa]